MPIVNLHNHSRFSDGTLEPSELIRYVKRAGIDYFALTDHDTMDGQVSMAEALKGSGICYCSGVEISCSPLENLHLLGYGIRPEGEAFEKFRQKLAGFRARRADRIREVLELLKGLGIDIAFEEIIVPEGKTIGRPHVADCLKKKGIVSSRNQAFKRYLAPTKPAYVPPNGPSVEEACEAVRSAGGIPILAHPGCVAQHLELPKWKEAGLAGVEAYYPTHSNTFVRELINLSTRYELIVTAGIDFHGPGTDRDKMFGFQFEEDHFSACFSAFSDLFVKM